MGDEEVFKAYEQGQGQLFPAQLAGGLESGDPAFFIDEVVEALDLEGFERRYARRGEHAYAPRMLLKLWLYGASQGVHSGREIARKIYRDPGFRYLAGEGPYPDFRTINRFRVRHREDFAEVCRQTVTCGLQPAAAARGPRTGVRPARAVGHPGSDDFACATPRPDARSDRPPPVAAERRSAPSALFLKSPDFAR